MPDLNVTTLVDVASDLDAPVNNEGLVRAVRAAFLAAREDESPPAWLQTARQLEVSVRVTNNNEIQALNSQYRGVDKPTDVLSFSFVEGEDPLSGLGGAGEDLQLGEIVLSYPYCVAQAHDLGHSVDMELSWLTIHGALQLVGYVHDTDSAAERMEALELAALRSLGFEYP